MQIRFDGRVALVTGAAQGIGQAIARALKASGATVVAADADRAGVEAFAAGEGMTTQVFDVGQQAACHAAVAAVAKDKGRLDILVNCAGGVRGQVGRPIETVPDADWKVIFEANVDGAFYLAQAAAGPMKEGGFGRIVNIASGAGLRPSLTGIQAYTAAKHALVGLTKQLSQDLGPSGVTCNAVAPGFVRSNPRPSGNGRATARRPGAPRGLRPHASAGKAEDIANAVVFLASEQAAWISGQILSVDGGRS